MNFFGRRKREESALSEEVREELEALCDQAELAESVEEHRAINKSILELVGEGMDEIVKAVGKQRAKARRKDEEEDEDQDEEFEEIEDGFEDEEPDEEQDEDEAADDELLKRLKRPRSGGKGSIRKSVQEDPEENEDEGAEVDATPILKSIAERLGEFEGVQTDMRKSAARLSRLESRFDEVSAALTPVLEFIDEQRGEPVGTPRGSAPLAAGAVHKSIAATTGQAEYSDVTLGDGSTLRGLTEMQLLKGVAAYLDKNGETNELGISDLHRIGREPIGNLNPKIAEFAAQGLGIALEE